MSTEKEPKKAAYASEKGEVVLRPHEYDGIQEYDQTLPNWWLFIFFSAIVFFPLSWLAYYQFGFMRSDEEVIDEKMAEIARGKEKALQEMLAKLDDNALVQVWAADDAVVAAGQETFMANCTACHGQDLSGRFDMGNGQTVALPGLPLNDGEWKYGGRPMEIFKLIHDGTPPESPGHNGAKMEAWGQKMSPMKVAEITAFLIRSNPADFADDPG